MKKAHEQNDITQMIHSSTNKPDLDCLYYLHRFIKLKELQFGIIPQIFFCISVSKSASILLVSPNYQTMQNKYVLSLADLSLEYFIDLENSKFDHVKLFQTAQKIKPWQNLSKIAAYLQVFFRDRQKTQNKAKLLGSSYVEGQRVFIDQGTVIEHGAMIKSPCIIGKNCEIRKGAYLRGNVIIGDNVVIGNSCQIKNSIIFNQCQIPHFNYVGDSILGTKAHLAAGAITSNFRLDGKQISVSLKQQESQKTGLKKFGSIIGDRSQIGCNVVLNPGSLIGKDSWVYPNVTFRGFLESNKILKLKQQCNITNKEDKINKTLCL